MTEAMPFLQKYDITFLQPLPITARACVLIFQAFQLFSSSVQFCGRSKLPYPCRPESHKRNTCELASTSCSLCRSTLPCRQVRRVTNIYVFPFCVSSLSSFCILSNSSISVLLAGRTAFLLSCATAPQSGQRSGSFSAEQQRQAREYQQEK